MSKIKNMGGNTYYGTLVSKGYSLLTISGYMPVTRQLTQLVFDFSPWLGEESDLPKQYDKSNRLSTSVNPEGAAYFYMAAVSILRAPDSTERVQATLPCKNGASLEFNYTPDENNEMAAYIVITKNGRTIPHKFSTIPKRVMLNGQVVTQHVQADLALFAMTLFGYIVGQSVGEFPGEEYLKRVFEDGINP
jgi:hypothetical protein